MSASEEREVRQQVKREAAPVLALALGVLLVIALILLGILVGGNLVGLAILVAGLVTTSTRDLGGVELLMTGAAIWITNVIVFGIWYWEIDAGGPVARALHARSAPDFQFPQYENPSLASPG